MNQVFGKDMDIEISSSRNVNARNVNDECSPLTSSQINSIPSLSQNITSTLPCDSPTTPNGEDISPPTTPTEEDISPPTTPTGEDISPLTTPTTSPLKEAPPRKSPDPPPREVSTPPREDDTPLWWHVLGNWCLKESLDEALLDSIRIEISFNPDHATSNLT